MTILQMMTKGGGERIRSDHWIQLAKPQASLLTNSARASGCHGTRYRLSLMVCPFTLDGWVAPCRPSPIPPQVLQTQQTSNSSRSKMLLTTKPKPAWRGEGSRDNTMNMISSPPVYSQNTNDAVGTSVRVGDLEDLAYAVSSQPRDVIS